MGDPSLLAANKNNASKIQAAESQQATLGYCVPPLYGIDTQANYDALQKRIDALSASGAIPGVKTMEEACKAALAGEHESVAHYVGFEKQKVIPEQRQEAKSEKLEAKVKAVQAETERLAIADAVAVSFMAMFVIPGTPLHMFRQYNNESYGPGNWSEYKFSFFIGLFGYLWALYVMAKDVAKIVVADKERTEWVSTLEEKAEKSGSAEDKELVDGAKEVIAQGGFMMEQKTRIGVLGGLVFGPLLIHTLYMKVRRSDAVVNQARGTMLDEEGNTVIRRRGDPSLNKSWGSALLRLVQGLGMLYVAWNLGVSVWEKLFLADDGVDVKLDDAKVYFGLLENSSSDPYRWFLEDYKASAQISDAYRKYCEVETVQMVDMAGTVQDGTLAYTMVVAYKKPVPESDTSQTAWYCGSSGLQIGWAYVKYMPILTPAGRPTATVTFERNIASREEMLALVKEKKGMVTP